MFNDSFNLSINDYVSANPPFLRHVTKGRAPIPIRRIPNRYSGRAAKDQLMPQSSVTQAPLEPGSAIRFDRPSVLGLAPSSSAAKTVTEPKTPVTESRDEDEIMV